MDRIAMVRADAIQGEPAAPESSGFPAPFSFSGGIDRRRRQAQALFHAPTPDPVRPDYYHHYDHGGLARVGKSLHKPAKRRVFCWLAFCLFF
ncbi:MAG: hypothetical protein ACN6PB_27710 [Achromobacter kerstersii]|uniref:hypothetical protein n=1 Tax=Achromobacter kerstersii TaxID=1353890 RepID=UPI003CFF96AA